MKEKDPGKARAVWRLARKIPIVVSFREVKGDVETIATPEGIVKAFQKEDLIVCGIAGELYPIKKKIFKESFEILEGQGPGPEIARAKDPLDFVACPYDPELFCNIQTCSRCPMRRLGARDLNPGPLFNGESGYIWKPYGNNRLYGRWVFKITLGGRE